MGAPVSLLFPVIPCGTGKFKNPPAGGRAFPVFPCSAGQCSPSNRESGREVGGPFARRIPIVFPEDLTVAPEGLSKDAIRVAPKAAWSRPLKPSVPADPRNEGAVEGGRSVKRSANHNDAKILRSDAPLSRKTFCFAIALNRFSAVPKVPPAVAECRDDIVEFLFSIEGEAIHPSRSAS